MADGAGLWPVRSVFGPVRAVTWPGSVALKMLIDNALAQLTGAILIPVSCANMLIARYLSATAIAPSETPALATAPPQMLPTTPASATAPQSLFSDLVQRFGTSGCYLCSNKKN